jgi:hypothetical protein
MKRFLMALFLVLSLTNPSIVFADVKSDVATAINEAMAFGSMFPPGTKKVSESQHEKAANHLKEAIKYGTRPDQSELERIFDKAFVNEWNGFMMALKYRLNGWQKPNVAVSARGIDGMERFRSYYNKNSDWIIKRINDTSSGSSWFSWNPSKGELLPRIGCEKGAVIAWLAGCG